MFSCLRRDDDSVLWSPVDHWIFDESIDSLLHEACNDARVASLCSSPSGCMQSKACKLLVECAGDYDIHALLIRRYSKRASFEAAQDEAYRAIALLSIVRGAFPAATATALKTILNAWCTAGNFSSAVGACVFCGLENGDSMEQFSKCGHLNDVAQRCCRQALPEVSVHIAPMRASNYANACCTLSTCAATSAGTCLLVSEPDPEC